MTDGLFEMDAADELQPGERVIARCAWGDEQGHFVERYTEAGYPLLRIQIDMGTVSLSPGRVCRAG